MKDQFQCLDNKTLQSKWRKLESLLANWLPEGLLVAFSGGVDSSFLLWSAQTILNKLNSEQGEGKLLAILADSPSLPRHELEAACAFATSICAPLLVKRSHEVTQESYAKNDALRCYYCKSELFELMQNEARTQGFSHLAYGYNASDRADIRFGHLAAQENQIHSPLEAAGLEKSDIRELLAHLGFAISDKPASPCLASRIMTGVRVTEAKLSHVEQMESILRNAQFDIYRVRLHEEQTQRYFRIEIAPEHWHRLLSVRESLLATAKSLGYSKVTLDLAGYHTSAGTT